MNSIPHKPVRLRAGTIFLDYCNGQIRYVRSGKTEIVRMIYPAFRDSDWLNVEGIISDETFDIREDSFGITYNIRYKREEIDFAASVNISGTRQGTISFHFEGEALTSFRKNRVGLCLHHPVEECAGQSCTIIHPDNSSAVTVFPEMISPHQPFLNIRSMLWSAGGLDCRADFEGDVFETEDQRNWTDASFKTYSTPLELPFPVSVNKGSRVRQSIRVMVNGYGQAADVSEELTISIAGTPDLPMPETGTSMPYSGRHLTEDEIVQLKKLGLDHYRVDLHLYFPGWDIVLLHAIKDSLAAGCSLVIALFVDEDPIEEILKLVGILTRNHADISAILLYDRYLPSTSDLTSDALAPLLKSYFPGIKIAAGTNANFAQLNRMRPQTIHADAICYAIHPQEHATDDMTMIENLKGQEYTAASCRSFSGKKSTIVSPVTMRRRFNANNTFIEEPDYVKHAEKEEDVRLRTCFGASWSLISLKYLAEQGVKGITYYEAAGNRGIISGKINPLYSVFGKISYYKDYSIRKTICSDSLIADSMMLVKDNEAKLFLVNFSPDNQKIRLDFKYRLLKISQINDNDEGLFKELSLPGNLTKTEPDEMNLNLSPNSITFIELIIN